MHHLSLPITTLHPSPHPTPQEATLHLVSVLKNPSERGAAFEALGETAATLARINAAGGMEGHLPAVAAQIRETISVKGGRFKNTCPAALAVRFGKWGVGVGVWVWLEVLYDRRRGVI